MNILALFTGPFKPFTFQLINLTSVFLTLVLCSMVNQKKDRIAIVTVKQINGRNKKVYSFMNDLTKKEWDKEIIKIIKIINKSSGVPSHNPVPYPRHRHN